MNLKFYCIVLLIFSTTLTASEFSQEDDRMIDSMDLYELMETDISTGTPINQEFAPSVTSIITSDEIRKSGARTLHEALESVPGLHVYPAQGYLMKSNISIRGIATTVNPQILILIDGVPIRTTFYGSPSYPFTLPTSIIHRIEVIRGPGSALYGADAYSGVVNIVTKKWVNIKDEVGARYGSFDTHEVWLNTHAEAGEISAGLSLSLAKSDGDNGRVVHADGFSPSPSSLAPSALDSRYDTMTLHADISYKDFTLNIMTEKGKDLGLYSGVSQTLDHKGYVDRDTLLLDLRHVNKTLFEDTTIKSGISHYSYTFDALFNIFPAGAELPFGTFPDGAKIVPKVKEHDLLVYVNSIYTGIDNHTISSGIGYTYGKTETEYSSNFGAGVTNIGTLTDLTGTLNTLMPTQSRNSYYALLQDEYQINSKLMLTSGVRYDNYSDIGSTVNPRLALVWQQSNDVIIKFMYAKAFRAPSFGELYLQNNPVTLGNADLNPETIDTYEVAINYYSQVHTKLNLFYYKAKDLIDYVTDTNSETKTAQNTKNQNTYGFELELEYAITGDLIARGNYSYQDSEDAKTKEKSAGTPVQQAFAQLQYAPNSDWNVNTQYHYIGNRYREAGDTRKTMGSDSLVNLTIERKNIWHDLNALVSARNLFDTDYREPSNGQIAEDYPMQGRYVFAEISYLF